MEFQDGDIVVSTIEGINYKLSAVAKFHKYCGTTGKIIVIPINGFKSVSPAIVTCQYWRKLGE